MTDILLYLKKHHNFYFIIVIYLMSSKKSGSQILEEKVIKLDTKNQNLKNKKIYFDSDWTEVKIGYDENTWVGFVEIISE